jgi:hypothetical protein
VQLGQDPPVDGGTVDRTDLLPFVGVEAVDVRVEDVQPVDVPEREERSTDDLLERLLRETPVVCGVAG